MSNLLWWHTTVLHWPYGGTISAIKGRHDAAYLVPEFLKLVKDIVVLQNWKTITTVVI